MHKVKEFELRDVDGGVHKYICETHPAPEGMPIAWTLLKAGVPAAVEAAIAMFTSGPAQPFSTIQDKGIEIGPLLSKGLEQTNGPAFARAILDRTMRDGVKLTGGGFDDAYGGNYPEMYEALVEVVQHNRFLPALDRLAKLLPQAKATPTPS